jgi:hypothetical protein
MGTSGFRGFDSNAATGGTPPAAAMAAAASSEPPAMAISARGTNILRQQSVLVLSLMIRKQS